MDTGLNERIAVEVMGYQFSTPPEMVSNHWWRKKPDGYVDVCFDGLPSYDKYMQYAWLVVDELHKRGVYVMVNYSDDITCRMWYPHEDIVAYGFHQPTTPLAICHAALDICEKLKKVS